jgi:hypothetical protein
MGSGPAARPQRPVERGLCAAKSDSPDICPRDGRGASASSNSHSRGVGRRPASRHLQVEPPQRLRVSAASPVITRAFGAARAAGFRCAAPARRPPPPAKRASHDRQVRTTRRPDGGAPGDQACCAHRVRLSASRSVAERVGHASKARLEFGDPFEQAAGARAQIVGGGVVVERVLLRGRHQGGRQRRKPVRSTIT